MLAQPYVSRWFATTALAACMCFQSSAQSTDKPLLLIETGRHSAPITAISATKDGSLFVTSSSDKTIRIWNAEGRQLQVIRPPVGGRANDSIYSVAISPGGGQVAFQCSKLEKFNEKGRFVTVFPVHVLNLKTQKLSTIARYAEPVNLGFSPDGRYIASISAFISNDGASIEVYRVTDWALYGYASGIKFGGAPGPATFDFAPDGNRIAVTIGSKTQVLAINGADYNEQGLYGVSQCRVDDSGCVLRSTIASCQRRLSTKITLKPAGGMQPIGVKWSPNGKWLAYGYTDSPSVSLVSTVSWSQTELPATGLQSAYLNGPKTMGMLTWSLDSKALLSSGTMAVEVLGHTVLRKWIVGTKPTFEDTALEGGIHDKLGVDGIVPTRSGYAFASGDALGFYDNKDSIRVLEPSSGLRGNTSSIENTPNGLVFYIDYPKKDPSNRKYLILGETYSFDVLRRSLRPEPNSLPHDYYAVEEAPGMDNAGLLSDMPVLNGVRLEIDSRSMAFTFTADGQTLLLGTLQALYRFDRNGSQLWRVVLPASAKALNVSRDGKLVLLVLGDGTLRWYRLLDGKELAAFYAMNDRSSWAMWTPDGYFDASFNGSIILNRGVIRADGLVEAEPLSPSSPLYRPDKINDALTKVSIIGEASAIPSRP